MRALPAEKPTPMPQPWRDDIARHNHRVVLSLLALGLAPDVARDIAQSAWLRLVDKQQAGQLAEVRLPGLAIAQARFLALDHLRRERRERRAHVDDERLLEVSDAARGPEGRVLDDEQLAHALAELARCPPRAREVFLLLYEEPSLSHKECAERAGLSVQRVRQIACEVRARLRAAIEQGGAP